MIAKIYHSTRADGVKLYKTYSTDNFKIRQVETGHVYDTAIDVEGAPFTYEETAEMVAAAVKKYSTLKIIRALGSEWDTYKAQLESAGLLDQFFAANYLLSTDPVFAAFISGVPAELKAKLDDCLWEEN
jgi:hypothetical protein